MSSLRRNECSRLVGMSRIYLNNYAYMYMLHVRWAQANVDVFRYIRGAHQPINGLTRSHSKEGSNGISVLYGILLRNPQPGPRERERL